MPKVNFEELKKKKSESQEINKKKEEDLFFDETPKKEDKLVFKEAPKKPKIKQGITENNMKEYPLQIIEDYKNLPEIEEPKFFSKEMMAEALDMYRYLIKQIIKETDFQTIGKNKFLKRSGYRKIAQAYGITTKQIGKEEFFEREGETYARVKVVASMGECNYKEGLHMLIESKMITPEQAVEMIAKLGSIRYSEGLGIVSMNEIKFHKNRTIHNLVAHAYTRAENRAIADLVGFGIVSATEVNVNKDKDIFDPFTEEE